MLNTRLALCEVKSPLATITHTPSLKQIGGRITTVHAKHAQTTFMAVVTSTQFKSLALQIAALGTKSIAS